MSLVDYFEFLRGRDIRTPRRGRELLEQSSKYAIISRDIRTPGRGREPCYEGFMDGIQVVEI